MARDGATENPKNETRSGAPHEENVWTTTLQLTLTPLSCSEDSDENPPANSNQDTASPDVTDDTGVAANTTTDDIIEETADTVDEPVDLILGRSEWKQRDSYAQILIH